jgi:hypothetical protein
MLTQKHRYATDMQSVAGLFDTLDDGPGNHRQRVIQAVLDYHRGGGRPGKKQSKQGGKVPTMPPSPHRPARTTISMSNNFSGGEKISRA